MDLSSYKDPIKYDNNRNYVWNRLHVWSSANMMISYITYMILCIDLLYNDFSFKNSAAKIVA